MNKKFYLLLFIIFSFSCNNSAEQGDFVPLTKIESQTTDTLDVGSEIIFKKLPNFEDLKNSHLKISHIYGTFYTKAEDYIKGNTLVIPSKFTHKQGLLKVSLYKNGTVRQQSQYFLKAKSQVKQLENYFGQKFVHLDLNTSPQIVTFLLDDYGNLTELEEAINYEMIQNQKLEKAKIEEGKEMVVFEMPEFNTIGKKNVSIHYQDINSEEETYYILSGLPQNFTIKSSLTHNLADGNTIYKIETSPIKDRFGNWVDDGTQVEFYIKDQKNLTVRKKGLTINGIAKIELLHPINETQYNILAVVLPQAKSNTLNLNFEKAIDEIPILQKGRNISIGPIVTKNKNYVAHATEVNIKLFDQKGNLKKSWSLNTDQGRVRFEIPEFIPEGEYNLQVYSLGHSAPFKKIVL